MSEKDERAFMLCPACGKYMDKPKCKKHWDCECGWDKDSGTLIERENT